MLDIVKNDLKKISNSEKTYDGVYEDEMASVYDLFYSDIDGWYEGQKKIVEDNYNGKTLELACGTGILLSMLEDNIDITGLDISSSMIRVAKERVDCPLIQGDFNSINMESDFDTVVMLGNPLNHYPVSEAQEVISNVKELLSENGVFIYDIVPHSKWNTESDLNIGVANPDGFRITRAAFSQTIERAVHNTYKNKVYFNYRIKDLETGSHNSISIDIDFYSHRLDKHREFLKDNGFTILDEGENEYLKERKKYYMIASN